MGRRDEINIVASLLLQFEHDCGQIVVGHLPAVSLMTDLKILAKETEQVTMGKKNGTGAMGADQWIFFPEMGIVTGNPGKSAGVAEPRFAGLPITAAFSGTKYT